MSEPHVYVSNPGTKDYFYLWYTWNQYMMTIIYIDKNTNSFLDFAVAITIFSDDEVRNVIKVDVDLGEG